ncbi:MAG: SIR2 family NAD-dependent protein deacylase [Bryobacteraceae bacterium]
MFNADPQTFDSLKLLWGLATNTDHKPVIIWVGAGASSWLGYERWAEAAERFHRAFLRKASARYMAEAGSAALKAEDYPRLFQLCFDASPETYRSMLAQSFAPKPMQPVYRRFVEAVNRLEGVSVVTTNVDEMLENSLPGFQVLQRSDLSRVTDLLGSRNRFLAKLHGSVSSIQTAVFKTDDYKSLEGDSSFVDCLSHMLAGCSIVFIGYGIRDAYVIELLNRSASIHSLFGDGPHFLVSPSPSPRPELPSSVHPVQYRTDFHTDHRSGILAIELIARPASETGAFEYGRPAPRCQEDLRSAHFLSDFYPAGTWQSGQTAAIKREDGIVADIIVGPGWTSGEISPISTAAHDLAVGLMCFDQVLVPLDCINRVCNFVGENHFRTLVFEGILEPVHWEGFDLLMCFSDRPGFGSLATGKKGGGESAGEVIRKQMRPAVGHELEGSDLISRLEDRVITVDLSGTKNFADICSGLFSSPATRKILGMSDATPVGHIPRWLAHPALRLVQVARIGATCQKLALGSMKLMTGAARLAEVAFPAVAGGVLASEVASYALTGQFGIVDQDAFLADRRLWGSVLKFRQTTVGIQFRREIHKRLLSNEAAEIVPAIDSSLRQVLPTGVMQSARRQLSALLISGRHDVVPAIWNDSTLLENGPAAWRRMSKQRLLDLMAAQRVAPYDDCPCGSYERAKFCCLAALE